MKVLSEPISTDDGYYRGWQTQDAIQFVKEEFKISYSKSRMRQIIKDLGYRKLTYKPGSRKKKEALTEEFIAKAQKKITEP